MAAMLLGAIQTFAQAPANYHWQKSYTNPLQLASPLGPAVSCPDPAISKQRVAGSDTWYLYCTGDPLNAGDVSPAGGPNSHFISQFRSFDLIHWNYIGDAFQHAPAWVGKATNQFWAAAVEHFNDKYYLYYVAPNTPQGGAAIGVATSASPAGPWTDAGAQVVAPGNNPYNGAPGRAVIDSDVTEDDAALK